MADASLRLLLMLQQIPREPRYISSQQLYARLADAGYGVSLRTVQRDLVKLSSHFPLVQSEASGRGKTGVAWAFAKDSQHMAFPGMDAVTALTVSMALEHLKPLLPRQVLQHLQPWQEEAEEQLHKLNCSRFQGWMDKVRIAPQHFLQAPQVDAEAVGLIYQALLDNRQFRATYKGKPERIIHPYGLVQQGHTLYVLCRFYQFDDVRITALHRYQSVELLEASVRPFPEFNIDDYLESGAMHWILPDQQCLELRLRISPWLAQHLEETPLSDKQSVTIDPQNPERYLLDAEVLDGMQLRRWLLSQGAGLQVLGPAQLREWMAEIVREQAQNYLQIES
ncbi:WYL domain-containing protein [Pseudomonas sp. C27(2019)]|uniref:helix-turn-helix transcriptional regulator n=1 Tax=Pseudomonas sp. C27(2019) TaxID=2604941 RepID=UPI00124761C9|nr:WYL domain-containing protein [Pseudomonas sp. C27(2019)]QEY59091.1 WYL domain-containing protein [Pseudomonas sp. C27(2019)]